MVLDLGQPVLNGADNAMMRRLCDCLTSNAFGALLSNRTVFNFAEALKELLDET
jgi:hypothetical protein